MQAATSNSQQYGQRESDCILDGYILKLGGPFASAWETRYGKLYPNRLELHTESSSAKPELIFMDQIEVVADYVIVKEKQCIVLKMKAENDKDINIVLTNTDEIVLEKWLTSLKSTYQNSLELLTTIAKKVAKIYGPDAKL